MKLSFLVLLIIHCNSILTKEQISASNNIINMKFQFSPSSLPYFLTQYVDNVTISSIRINMGSRYSSSLKNQRLPINGISTYIQNRSVLSNQKISVISGLFSISSNKPYLIVLSELNNSLIISNPNDKFCSEQVQQIINNILPCHDKSGISSLIDNKILFISSYVGLYLQWEINIIKINLYILRISNNINNIQKNKIYTKCFEFQNIQIINDQMKQIQWQKFINIDQLFISKYNKIISQTNNNSYSKRFIKTNWYGKKKILYQNIIINQCYNIKQIIIRYLFPSSFIPIQQSIEIINQNQQEIHYYMKIRTNYQSILIQLSIHSFNQQSQICQLYLKIPYYSNLLSFQHYQAIAGGGEQFMKIPIIIINNNHQINQINVDAVSDHRMEPDFSIPFHVITFTTAILGYLWVGLWRAYFHHQKWIQINQKFKKD